MSRYQAYPAYKDSGIKWLGLIPVDWNASKLKYEAMINMGQSPNSDDCNQDGIGIPFLQGNAEFGKRSPVAKNYCEHPRKIARKGEYLLSVRAPVGALNYADQVYGIGRGLCSIANNQSLCSEYMWWLISVIKTELDSVSTGSTFEAVSAEQVGNSNLFLPPVSDQIKVAKFLTHETAKIDALIEKQQRLIELLKEKRQAVISHAVTKGLNPNAPMKDSGVEWLGEIPAHWDVHAIKHIVSTPITDGPHETPEFFDTGIPFVSAEAVSSGRIDFEKIRAHISDADNQRYSKKYSPKKFDIYMVKSGATTGVTAIVETDDVFNIWSPLAAIRCNELNYPYFVLNFMRSRNFADAIAISWSFGTQQNIGMKVIENLSITRPPLSEAIEIAKYLQEKSAKFDKIILRAQAQIELMQERRTALISAAVTGKIDVRDWQAAA